jgi:hypothetical protein
LPTLATRGIHFRKNHRAHHSRSNRAIGHASLIVAVARILTANGHDVVVTSASVFAPKLKR